MTSLARMHTVVVPGAHLMAALLGQRDANLRQIEAAFPDASIAVRGNEVHRRRARRPTSSPGCSRSWSCCCSAATSSTSGTCAARSTWSRADERPSEVLTDDMLRGAKGSRCARRPPARSATSTPSATTSSRSASARPAPARPGWPWRWPCRRCRRKQVQRIILTRPAVEAGERLGFLPGDLMAKIDPYLRPLYDALYDMVEPEGAQKLLERQTVEVAPLAFMRGRTLNNSFIILDEAQNTDARADEDVPHPHRLRLEGRRHRRHHAGRRARRSQRPARAGARAHRHRRADFVHLGAADVVRHRIVADIVAAYERDDECRTTGLQARAVTRCADRRCRSRQTSGGAVTRGRSSPTSRPTSPSTSTAGSRWPRAVLHAEGVRGLRAVADVRRRGRDRRAERRATWASTVRPTCCRSRSMPSCRHGAARPAAEPRARTVRRPTAATCRCCSATS